MHYLAYVRIPEFYCRALQTQASDQPCVVHKYGEVIDANVAARILGVTLGMRTQEAKVVTQGQGMVAWTEEPFRVAASQWLDICAEFADQIEPLEQDSAFLDLSAHPKPEFLVEALAAKLGKSQIGVASCKWLAALVARLGDPQRLALVTPRRYVAPLPTDLLPISPRSKARLQFLGYRTISEVAGLDFAVLRRQFDEEAFEIRRAAHGGGDTTVQALYPPNALATHFAFESAPDSIETLTFGLSRLAGLLGDELESRELYGERLELIAELEIGTVEIYARRFTKPFSAAKSVLTGLRLLLPTVLPQGIVAVRARAYDLRRLQRVQADFQNNTAHKQASAIGAVTHVRAVFGDLAIQKATEIVELRRVKVLRAWSEANGWK